MQIVHVYKFIVKNKIKLTYSNIGSTIKTTKTNIQCSIMKGDLSCRSVL